MMLLIASAEEVQNRAVVDNTTVVRRRPDLEFLRVSETRNSELTWYYVVSCPHVELAYSQDAFFET